MGRAKTPSKTPAQLLEPVIEAEVERRVAVRQQETLNEEIVRRLDESNHWKEEFTGTLGSLVTGQAQLHEAIEKTLKKDDLDKMGIVQWKPEEAKALRAVVAAELSSISRGKWLRTWWGKGVALMAVLVSLAQIAGGAAVVWKEVLNH